MYNIERNTSVKVNAEDFHRMRGIGELPMEFVKSKLNDIGNCENLHLTYNLIKDIYIAVLTTSSIMFYDEQTKLLCLFSEQIKEDKVIFLSFKLDTGEIRNDIIPINFIEHSTSEIEIEDYTVKSASIYVRFKEYFKY